MTEQAHYAYWREELANPGCNERDTNRLDLCGYYRIKRAKTKPDYAVAIWRSGDSMVCRFNQDAQNQIAEAEDPERWFDFLTTHWLHAEAVTYEAYCDALDQQAWPDKKPIRNATLMGHNLPDDPHAALVDEIGGLLETMAELVRSPVENDEDADICAATAKKLAAAAKSGKTYHKAEKQPHLDAGRAVDSKWFPDIRKAEEAAKDLKSHIAPWLKKKAEAERERQRKAMEEAAKAQREAEEARKAAEAEAARSSEDAGEAAEAAQAAQEAADAAAEAARAKSTAAGRTGARVALRKTKRAHIVSYDQLLEAVKHRPEVESAVEKIAGQAARAGNELPGMKIVIEETPA